MKFFPKSLHHLWGELGIQGINLAWLARSKMNDQKGYDGDKKNGNDLLYDASANK